MAFVLRVGCHLMVNHADTCCLWGFSSFLPFESGKAGVDVGCEAEDGGGVDEGFTHVGHDGVGEFSNGRNDEGRDVECYA